jgi:hypothetical protein
MKRIDRGLAGAGLIAAGLAAVRLRASRKAALERGPAAIGQPPAEDPFLGLTEIDFARGTVQQAGAAAPATSREAPIRPELVARARSRLLARDQSISVDAYGIHLEDGYSTISILPSGREQQIVNMTGNEAFPSAPGPEDREVGLAFRVALEQLEAEGRILVHRDD